MKKIYLFLSIFVLLAQACSYTVTIAPANTPAPLPVNTNTPAAAFPTLAPPTPTSIPATTAPTSAPTRVSPTATSIPATAAPTDLPTPQPPANNGVQVGVGPLSVFLQSGLATGARGILVPRAEGANVAPPDVTPGHSILKLEGYRLQGKFHQPQIYVYPGMGYAELVPGAFESIHRLDNILYGPGGPVTADQLPTVPFFNAQQAFVSHIQIVSFQNGSGVRFLTEYAQYPVSANNHDLFYEFQGLTRDGAYYVIVILPISNPGLAETSDPGAPLPQGGIPYPANLGSDMPAYYNAVTNLLDAAPEGSFTPAVNQLDALIQSMRISD